MKFNYTLNKTKNGIILIKDFLFQSFDTFRNEILQELKNAKYNDIEYMVYRTQLTYDEIIDLLDLKNIPSKRRVYSYHRYIRS